MTEALHGMPSIPNHVKMNLNNLLTYDKIKHALTTSPNGKATGMNGIPTDLYKEINNRHKKKEKWTNQALTYVVELLKAAFNNIEINSIQTPHILDGWLCPLYKKKDHCEIPNYRPITILNTEYKILTTVIMNKLSHNCPQPNPQDTNCIHKRLQLWPDRPHKMSHRSMQH